MESRVGGLVGTIDGMNTGPSYHLSSHERVESLLRKSRSRVRLQETDDGEHNELVSNSLSLNELVVRVERGVDSKWKGVTKGKKRSSIRIFATVKDPMTAQTVRNEFNDLAELKNTGYMRELRIDRNQTPSRCWSMVHRRDGATSEKTPCTFLLAYDDYEAADKLKTVDQYKLRASVIRAVLRERRDRIFSKADVTFTWQYFPVAYHAWVKKGLLESSLDTAHFAGEAYSSQCSGWMEGALHTAEGVCESVVGTSATEKRTNGSLGEVYAPSERALQYRYARVGASRFTENAY
eukprot:gene28660-35555_t